MYAASEFAIHIDRVTKTFGRVVAVDDLTLTVTAGEVFGFLGPNGAGKSTTIRLLLALIRPNAGAAQVFGDDAGDVRRAHRHPAYVSADVALWPALSGAEIVELLGNVGPGLDIDYRAELVERFDLDLDRPGKAYSTGNRQKVALIAAIATRAPLLVLDEPTSGLDPLMEREFRRCVGEARERGQAVFLSSHQLAEVEAICDRVAILRAERLVEIDTIADIRLRRTVVEVSYRDIAPSLTKVPVVSNVEHVDGSRLTNRCAPPCTKPAIWSSSYFRLPMKRPLAFRPTVGHPIHGQTPCVSGNPTVEEEGHVRLAASVAYPAGPTYLHRSVVGSGFAADNHPADAIEVDVVERTEKWFARKEPNCSWHLAKVVNSVQHVGALYRDSHPEIGRPVQFVGNSPETEAALGENLVGMLRCLSNDVDDVSDELKGHPGMNKVVLSG